MSLIQPNQQKTTFTEDQLKYILELFPESLKPYLEKCDNPLDETQMLLNLFKDKNVRIILKKEVDEFGDEEWIGYFHCNDLAIDVKYEVKHINQWSNKWNITFYKYKDLVHKNCGQEYCEINPRTTNANANYINEQDLKKVLIKINTKEAIVFQNWILRQATIMKKLIKYVIKIKHTFEAEQHKKEIKQHEEKEKLLTIKYNQEAEKHNQEKENLKKELEDKTTLLKTRTKQALIEYPTIKYKTGAVYIASSESKMKEHKYKIGQTHKTGEIRVNGMTTGDPTFTCLKDYKCVNVVLAEKILHDFLEHLKAYKGKEFFHVSSLDKCKNIVKDVTMFVNKLYDNHGDDYETLQDIYIGLNDTDTDTDKDEDTDADTQTETETEPETETQTETETETETDDDDDKNKEKDDNEILNEYKDKYLKNTKNKKDYIVWTELKRAYYEWYDNNYNKPPPNAKEIKKYFEDNVFKKTESSYTSDGKRFRGWLNWQLIINNKEKIN